MASQGSTVLLRNEFAGQILRELRIDRGLSPEALSWQISKAGLGFVSGRQIRRIERGVIPLPRTMFALARFFDRTPTSMWSPSHARPVRVAA